jgi:hypothetical protein
VGLHNKRDDFKLLALAVGIVVVLVAVYIGVVYWGG